jgi:hypothetical protein
MARLNIAPHVVDRILNHVSGTIRGVAAVYNRHAYLEERRAALEAWGRYVEGLVKPASANIVRLVHANSESTIHARLERDRSDVIVPRRLGN